MQRNRGQLKSLKIILQNYTEEIRVTNKTSFFFLLFIFTVVQVIQMIIKNILPKS